LLHYNAIMYSSSIFDVCTVFMVDDSPIIVGRVQDLLEEIKGVKFLGNAKSLSAILEVLSVDKPNVMILDINLGNSFPLNGFQLLAIVKRANPEISIIMLTNHSDAAYRKLCLEAGADYFFDKSNDFDKIPAALISVMRIKNET
jgi:DNA-binding NarL/FixJ family response regulator